MAKNSLFRIRLHRNIEQYCELDIEAPNWETAQKEAVVKADGMKLWRIGGINPQESEIQVYKGKKFIYVE